MGSSIAYGKCIEYKIDLPEDATPHEAWEALREYARTHNISSLNDLLGEYDRDQAANGADTDKDKGERLRH